MPPRAGKDRRHPLPTRPGGYVVPEAVGPYGVLRSRRLAIGNGARLWLWLSEAAAAGNHQDPRQDGPDVTLAKLVSVKEVDWGL